MGSLTQKIVRQKYVEHLGVERMDPEERAKLKCIVTELVEEYVSMPGSSQDSEVVSDKTCDPPEDGNLETGDLEQDEGQELEVDLLDVLPEDVETPKQETVKTKRKFASSQSDNADSSDSKSSRQPRKRKRLKSAENDNDVGTTCKSPTQSKSTKKSSPSKSSPRKQSPRKKSRTKRVSLEDARESVMRESQNSEVSSSEDESSDTEVQSPSKSQTPTNKEPTLTLTKPSHLDSNSDYGSPFKDESDAIEDGIFSDSDKEKSDSVQTKVTKWRRQHKRQLVESDSEGGQSEGGQSEDRRSKGEEVAETMEYMETVLSEHSDGSGHTSEDTVISGHKQKKTKSLVSGRSIGDQDSESSDDETLDQKKLKEKNSKKTTKNNARRSNISDDSDSSDAETSNQKKLKEKISKKTTPKEAKKSSISDDSDSSDVETSNQKKLKEKKSRKPALKEARKSCVSDDSDDETLDQTKVKPNKSKKTAKKEAKKSNISQDSGDSDTVVNEESDDKITEKSTKKAKKSHKRSKSVGSSRSGKENNKNSESSDVENSGPKSKNKNVKRSRKTKNENQDPTKTSHVMLLERMLRHCGLMPCGKNYSRTFAECDTAEKRVTKLKQILSDAGLEGNPTWKSIENLKLIRETAELDTSNILKEGGRGRRNIHSTYSRNKPPAKSPLKRTPIKETFRRLKGIVDSEDSDA